MSKDASKLDELERQIIAQLRTDGRRPLQTIARELGVDEKTVRNRVNKLRDNGLLTITATANGKLVNDWLVSLVAVHVSEDHRESIMLVADRIAELPMVSWVGTAMGRFDLFAEVVVESQEALAQFQMEVLPNIHGVAHTEGFLILSHHGTRGVPFVDEIISPSRS